MEGSLEKIEFEIKDLERTEKGRKYNVSIKVPKSLGWIERMKFITETNNVRQTHQLKHTRSDEEFLYFESNIELETSANYSYYFSFEANKGFIYYKKKNTTNYQTISDDEKWKMNVNFEVPDWAKGKIMYHIFVDRFNRVGNKLNKMPNRTIHENWDEDVVIGPNEDGIWNADFYGGNLKGIEEKLDYIKSLGVTILYLSPIVWSQSNHRYDTSDYEKLDPYVGEDSDLKSLCDKAHQMGMKVILDAVFNHTGNDSKYFNEYNNFNSLGAYQSKDSKYYKFFKKYYDGYNEYFDYWWGMKNLPVCDGNNKEWQEYIYGENGIIDHWFSLGIDGLRLDVADELTDEFIEGIRKAVKRNKEDGFIIGEVWKNPMRMNRGYISSGKCMDTVMNYLLVDALIRYFKYQDVDKLKRILYELKTEYPKGTLETLMNFTSTHDISRAINIFGCYDFNEYGEWAWNTNNDRNWQQQFKLSEEQYQKGKDIYKAYAFTLAFLPGILSIFYGDEQGLEGMGNLANRRTFPKEVKDEELLEFFKKIGRIRKEEHFLEQADLDILDVNERTFTFQRKNGNEEALININRTPNNQRIILPKRFENPDKIYRLNKEDDEELSPYGGLVLKKVLK